MNDNKIKVLHITQVSGGIQTYLEQIFDNINHQNFEMVLASPTERKSLIALANKYNIQHLNLDLRHEVSPYYDLLGVINIIKVIKKVKPDIVHAHSSKAGMLVRIASQFFKPKTLYTPNAYAYLGQKGIKRFILLSIEKMARPLTGILLAASKSEADRSIKELKFKESKVITFPNSIEFLEVGSKSDKINKPVKVVTMIGRLVKQKNPMMYLKVCNIIVKKRKDIFFQIIGAGFDDQLKAEIELFIKKHNLTEHFKIIFWMDRTEMLHKIRETDVFVMTSAFESFGYVAAEAQMLEIPVVATNVDGLNEIVADGVTGFLAEVNDANTMADKILYLVDNPEVAGVMGKNGRKRVLENFHIKNNIKILEDIYRVAAINR